MAVERKKILVIGPSWVGDMVMAQSLFMTLRQQNPRCSIDVLAPGWSFPLLERMPEVEKAVAMPLGHGQFGFQSRRQMGHQLRANQYDRAIVLPNSWKSALIPFFANIPLRSGYVGELRWGLLNDARRLDKQLLRMTVERFVALGLKADAGLPPKCPTPKLTVDANNQEKVQEKFVVTGQRNILALCPGAEYGPAKRWPATHYAELAREKLTAGWDVWLFGSAKDQPVTKEINRLTNSACHDFSGATSLGEAVDLMSMADAVVSNDSGLMHVAAALGKPLIAIYGSSDPGFTPPLSQDASIMNLQLDCSPCFKRDCPLGHTRCLTEITPQQVSAKITPH